MNSNRRLQRHLALTPSFENTLAFMRVGAVSGAFSVIRWDGIPVTWYLTPAGWRNMPAVLFVLESQCTFAICL
jgi:hypothetical protein